MRNTIILLLIIISSSSAFSQDQIIGTWDLDWNSTKTAAENEKYTAMPQTTRDRVKSSFSSRTYIFYANGTIQISWESENKEKTVSGTWVLEGNTLTISAEGKENQYAVDFSGSKLTLSKKGERNLFSVMVLNKRA